MPLTLCHIQLYNINSFLNYTLVCLFFKYLSYIINNIFSIRNIWLFTIFFNCPVYLGLQQCNNNLMAWYLYWTILAWCDYRTMQSVYMYLYNCVLQRFMRSVLEEAALAVISTGPSGCSINQTDVIPWKDTASASMSKLLILL